MSVSADTRFDSMKKVDKSRIYSMIIAALKSSPTGGLTARECSTVLYNQGKIYENSRQATAPRLTELQDLGVVEVVGKKYDKLTDRYVACYALALQDKTK